MRLVRESDGKPVTLGEPLGKGGQARVYRVVGQVTLAAKIYHAPTEMAARKLALMLAHGSPRGASARLTAVPGAPESRARTCASVYDAPGLPSTLTRMSPL